MIQYTKEELMTLCKKAVVNFKDWENRDSYIAQSNIEEAYNLFKANAPYEITSIENDETIWIRFKLNNDIHEEYCDKFEWIGIDSIDDYREEYGYESEMFDSAGINWESGYETSFIPTENRLKKCKDGDWY